MINEEELIEEIIREIIQNGDHFQIDEHCKCVWYSRYALGGAYESAFGYAVKDACLVLDKRSTHEQILVDLADPDSFKKAGEIIHRAVSEMQTDRCDHMFWDKETKRPGTVYIKRSKFRWGI